MRRLCTVGAAAAAMFLFTLPAGAQVKQASAPTVSAIYMGGFANKAVTDGVAVLTVYDNHTSTLIYTASYGGKRIRGSVSGTVRNGYLKLRAGSVSLAPDSMTMPRRSTSLAPDSMTAPKPSTQLAPPTMKTPTRTAVRATNGLRLPAPAGLQPVVMSATLSIRLGRATASFKPSLIGFSPAAIGMRSPSVGLSTFEEMWRKCTLVVATDGRRSVTLYAMTERGKQPVTGRVASRVVNGKFQLRSKGLRAMEAVGIHEFDAGDGVSLKAARTGTDPSTGVKLEQEGIHKISMPTLQIKTAGGQTVSFKPSVIGLKQAGIPFDDYDESGPGIVH